MATMNISLPDTMRSFVEEELTEGGYQTASEYFRDLVRERQQYKAQQKFEALIAEGLASEAVVTTPEFWAELETKLFGKETGETEP
jgi:antitoxin ParD1/3/4